MGGRGSGRWRRYEKKFTAADCYVLDVTGWILQPGQHIAGTLEWKYSLTGEPAGAMGYQIDTTNMTAPRVQLSYTILLTHEDLNYSIALEKTRRRWWWLCSCGKRTGKLYLPPGPEQSIFGCRVCKKLTYKSSQQSHTRHAEYEREFVQGLAADYPDIPLETVKHSIKHFFG